MPASFDYYKTFYFVAKYKNFTRAANILLSSQTSVTRSMGEPSAWAPPKRPFIACSWISS